MATDAMGVRGATEPFADPLYVIAVEDCCGAGAAGIDDADELTAAVSVFCARTMHGRLNNRKAILYIRTPIPPNL